MLGRSPFGIGAALEQPGLAPAVQGKAGALGLALAGLSVLPLCQTASLLTLGRSKAALVTLQKADNWHGDSLCELPFLNIRDPLKY